jgi:hypothetical protein
MTITNNAAYEIPDFYIGLLEANVDMSVESTWQYTGVNVGAASGAGLLGTAALIAPVSSGVAILGVLQNNPQLGEAGAVMAAGVSKVKAGGTFAIGDILMVNSSGAFVLATTGKFGVARALQAGSSGIYVSAYIHNYGLQA